MGFLWLLKSSEDGIPHMAKIINPSYSLLLICGFFVILIFIILEISRKSGLKDLNDYLKLWVLLVPLSFIPQALNARLTINRGTGITDASASIDRFINSELVEKTESEESVAVFDNILDIYANEDKAWGKSHTVTGIIHFPAGEGTDEALFYRYVLICCAADASPIELRISGEMVNSLKEGEWYSLTGTLVGEHMDFSDPEARLTLNVLSAERMEQPINPFIFPGY